jgi:hypothetical protein
MSVSAVNTPPIQPAQPPKRTEGTQKVASGEVKHKEPEVKKAPESRPHPVINTQGQTTGRLLNVTA